MNRELNQAIDYDLHKAQAQDLREQEINRVFGRLGARIAGLGKTRSKAPAPQTVVFSPHASRC